MNRADFRNKEKITFPQKMPGWFFLVLLFVVLSLLPACSAKKAKKASVAEKVPVTVASAIEKDIPIQLKAIGNVRPYSTVAITSLVQGKMLNVYFAEGQNVQKGQKLFLIDPQPFQITVSRMEAQLAIENAQLFNAGVADRRYAELAKKGYVAREQYENVHTQLATLEATFRSATQDLENAKLQLSYCTIYAPISGRTGSLLVHPGNLVKDNDQTNPLVIINQVQPILVDFSVPEQRLPEIRDFMRSRSLKVEVIVANDPTHSVSGSLNFIDNSVNSNTGTIDLKAVFSNQENRLWPGQFGSVVLDLTTRKNVVVIPTPAVQMTGESQFVFVVKPDFSVEKRAVEVTTISVTDTIVEKGILQGETVVTDGQLRLVPGAKIEIKGQKIS